MVMASGISPLTFCLGSRSEAWEMGTQRWDRGLSITFGDTGITYGIRDQNFFKKWAQGSKLSKNSGIIKMKIFHVTRLLSSYGLLT